ncbi:hypothetical protein VTO42DRAFT_7184 [Malbranchea cinnamomea]
MINEGQMLGLIWALWGLGFITTICRGVLRFRVQGKYMLEDYFALTGFIFLTALTAVITVLTPIFFLARGYMIAAAKNPFTPPPLPIDAMMARQVKALKLMFAQMLLFWSTLWAGKFSLLVFFRRLVIGLPRYMRAFWVVFALVLLTYLGCMISNFLTCKPLSKYWSETGCSDPENVRRADESIKFATGADVAADFLIMILPLRLLWNLQISRRQKVALACLFCLGLIVVAVAFIRLHYVTKATSSSQIDPTKMADGPLLLSLWSHIESSVAVVVANLPAFRSLLRKSGTTTHRSKQGNYPYYPRTRSSNTGGGTGKKLSAFAGTGGSGSRTKHWIESGSSETQIYNSCLEMQRLPSEESYIGRTEAREDGAATGIVRTMEFAIHSGHKSSFDHDDHHPNHTFVPKGYAS